MPVRVDRQPAGESGGDPGRRVPLTRSRIVALALVGAAVVLLVVALVVLLVRPGGSPSTPTLGPTPAVTPTPTSSAPSASGSASADLTRLPVSDVIVGGGGSGQINGLVIGYPHTLTGAVSAAINYDKAMYSTRYYDNDVRHQWNAYMYASPAIEKKIGVSDKTVAATRKARRLDSHGDPLDPTEHCYDAVYPRYGAYKTQVISADKVIVTIWEPDVAGTAPKGTLKGVKIAWEYHTMELSWVNGDWRWSGAPPDHTAPQPKDPSEVVNSFAERAELLGDEWTMPANAVETSIPELDLPEKS